MVVSARAALLVSALACACACVRSEATRPSAPAAAHTLEELRVRVVRTLPHDRAAFTQGLLLFEGKLYESTGLLGESTLRRVDPDSGVVEA